MRLLLDEMYPAVVAEQLRARGHDVVSVHDPERRQLEGAPDQEIFAAALADERALVTENVPDFRRLEAAALARGEPRAALVFTSNRQFPRGRPGTTGRLVEVLDTLLTERPTLGGSGRHQVASRPALQGLGRLGSGRAENRRRRIRRDRWKPGSRRR